jgi:hypothetical protein
MCRCCQPYQRKPAVRTRTNNLTDLRSATRGAFRGLARYRSCACSAARCRAAHSPSSYAWLPARSNACRRSASTTAAPGATIWAMSRRTRRPAVHRPARRTDHDRGSARRHTLGRGSGRAGIRAPAPAQPAPHRPDLDGRRRCPRARPTKDRRPRFHHDDPALLASGCRDHQRCRNVTHDLLERSAVPTWSPPQRDLDARRHCDLRFRRRDDRI